MESFDIVELGPRMLLLRGELDMGTAEQASSALAPAVTEGGPITVDISGLTFMDSSGLHAVMDAATSLKDRGCIIIHGLDGSASIRKLFELTQVGTVRNVHVIPCDVIA
jgi:anti-sigma B factor antagonist